MCVSGSTREGKSFDELLRSCAIWDDILFVGRERGRSSKCEREDNRQKRLSKDGSVSLFSYQCNPNLFGSLSPRSSLVYHHSSLSSVFCRFATFPLPPLLLCAGNGGTA